MKLVLQRVDEAWVTVETETVGRIGRGLLALIGVETGDADEDARKAADKVATVRLFADDAGKMNRALDEVRGAVLAVSQFTLLGSIARGRRPGFERAMEPVGAERLFARFVADLAGARVEVATGRFGAMMKVHLVNDGPATFLYDTRRAE